MEIDKTTLQDLAIFVTDEYNSVFDHINQCTSFRGKEQLKKNLSVTCSSVKEIQEVQQAIAAIAKVLPQWPSQISNGTIMVVEKYFDSRIDTPPGNGNAITSFSYKLFNKHDYKLVQYSMGHCFDFITGMQQIYELLQTTGDTGLLKPLLENVKKITQSPGLLFIHKYKRMGDMPIARMLHMANYILRQYRHSIIQLVHYFAQLDAWAGMARAMDIYKLVFPSFTASSSPKIHIENLFHILVPQPVAYDVSLNERSNFLFLTGANMAGKSTFIKALGIAVYLAHAGMGVPAQQMELSLFEGMLSNINVIDNIAKGESYFYNEVQRIKSTVQKVNDGKKWLVLIDELFKGTNVEDAMKCSRVVIEGLQKRTNALFVLSTHLYEIGEGLQQYPNMQFSYFETNVQDDKLLFNYVLKPGISNDRLGYLILEKEGVVKLLDKHT